MAETVRRNLRAEVRRWSRRFRAPSPKVKPVAPPLAITSFALVHAVTDGLQSAGVRARDIIVFDRFRLAR